MADVSVLMIISMFAGVLIVAVFLITAFAADTRHYGDDSPADGADLRVRPPGVDEPAPRPACRTRRLSEEERNGFCHVWNSVCERFADDPRTAVTYADLLLSDLMLQCSAGDPATKHGFPGGGKGILKDEYQTAHAIAAGSRLRNLNSEELAKAMDLYGDLFDNILRAHSRT
jgi:hypothetical protein